MADNLCLKCGKPITGKHARRRKYHKGICAETAYRERLILCNEEVKRRSKERTIAKRNNIKPDPVKIKLCLYCKKPITGISRSKRKYHPTCALMVHHEQMAKINERNYAEKRRQTLLKKAMKKTLHKKEVL